MSWGPVWLCYVRGNCVCHIFTGEGCLLNRAGGFLWITAGQPCVQNQPFLLTSYKLPTEYKQCQTHDVWIWFIKKKKRSNKPPSNCKLGYIFQTWFLQQILFSLIYEKLVTSVNAHGWVPSPRGLLGERAFNKVAVATGCPLSQLIMEEICHTSVKAGSFLSRCPQHLKTAGPMAERRLE